MDGRALRLEDINKSYRSRIPRRSIEAVKDLSLEVSGGEIFGLLGPNGAGKTTTLKIMLGMVFPDSGSGELLSRPLGASDAHRHLGFLPEQPYFYNFLTAEKALDLYGRFFGMGKARRAEKSSVLMEMVGLARDSHLTLDKYSKGMLQRFGLAQAMLNDPDLLILDEPSSGLDPLGQKEVRDILLGLKKEGKTIFLSSHQLSEVENICDSVCIISDGSVARQGKLSDLLEARDSTRITLEGGGAEALSELGTHSRLAERDGDRIVLEVPAEDALEVLERAKALDLSLVSALPVRMSLEDLFLESVRGEGE